MKKGETDEETSRCDQVSIATVNSLLPLWMENLGGNLSTILKEGDIRHILCKDLEKCPMYNDVKEKVLERGVEAVAEEMGLDIDSVKHILGPYPSPKICTGCPKFENDEGPALIIGAGPSLYEKRHLELLAEKGFNGKIFAVSKVLKDVLEHGIVPDYVIFLDAAAEDTDFIDYPIVDANADQMTALMSVNIHPTTVQRWKGKKIFFTGYIGEDAIPNIAHVIFLLTKAVNISTGGNVGGGAWSLAAYLGHKKIVLIGMDLGWKNKKQIYEYYPEIPKGQLKNRLDIKRYKHPIFKTYAYSDLVFDVYKESLLSWMVALYRNAGVETINATEGGTLYAREIRCIPFRQALEELK